MINKEITNEMIVKALENCSNEAYPTCTDCPLNEPSSRCIPKLAKLALDLVKNKDAEIDILLRKKHTLRDEIAEKDVEIFKLKEEIENLKLKIGGFFN